MVLLTSSTVSAIVSAAIISLFTFLLFLVGYVLQQQSVNALREAIRAPPPPKSTPTLPARFRKQENETESILDEADDDEDVQIQDEIDRFLGQVPSESSDVIEVDTNGPAQEALQPATRTESLAYILALAQPSTLCSAALFAQKLNLQPLSTSPDQPRLVLLYPSTWEMVASPLHMAALSYMRDMYDMYPVIFHPVEFIKGWEDSSTHSHLLGELQRTMWEFDRMLYLRAPGMVVDEGRVQNALRKSNIRKSWTPMTAAVGSDPEVLLWERKRGLLMPRGDLGALVSQEKEPATESEPAENTQENDEEVAAYVLFNGTASTGVLDKSELLREYEEGMGLVCKGKGLLPGEEDRIDLKRL